MTHARYCDACKAAGQGQDRPSPSKRGYGIEHQRMRKAVLARDPLCKIAIVCVRKFGHVMPSEHADHVDPSTRGKPIGLDGYQGACRWCNSWKAGRQLS